jgi:hypothetical protein
MEISVLNLCLETSWLCGLLAICAGVPLHRYNNIQISQHRLGLRGGFTSSTNSSSCLPCSLNLYKQPRLPDTVKADSLPLRELQEAAKVEIPSSQLFTWTSPVCNFLKQLRPCKFNLQNSKKDEEMKKLQEEITRKRAGSVKNFEVTLGTRAGFQEPHQSVSECKMPQAAANTLRIFIPSLFALSLLMTGNKVVTQIGHWTPDLKVPI